MVLKRMKRRHLRAKRWRSVGARASFGPGSRSAPI